MCRVWRSATAWLVCYRGFASCCKCGCKSGLALRSRRVIRATLCTLHSALCTFEGSLRLSLWPCDRRRVACVRVTSTVFPCPVSAQSSSRPQWIKGTVFSRFDLCLESLLSRLYGSPRVRFNNISPSFFAGCLFDFGFQFLGQQNGPDMVQPRQIVPRIPLANQCHVTTGGP